MPVVWRCITCGKEYSLAPDEPRKGVLSVWCIECKMRQKLGRCEIQETQEVEEACGS